ncbi:MAG: hypothetical protein SPL13_01805 [Clostridia bacterium]|nr:hypothetical protein [Clostridia bacterium]
MNWGALFIALFLTAFIYLIFPIVYLLKKGKVSVKKGRKMALINSIVCAVVFLIIAVIIASNDKSMDMSGYSLIPAVTYYFIAKFILTDKNINEKNDFISNNNQNKQSTDKEEKANDESKL